MKTNFSLAFIAVAFLLGAAAGSLIAMTVADGSELTAFFENMVEGAKDGVLRNSFWRVLLPNLLWPGLIILFSFSRIGLVGIPMCVFAKGFLVSYSVSAIFRALGLDGIWLALTAMGIPNFIYIPALVIVSVVCLRFASGERSTNISPYFHAVMFCVFIGLAAFQAYLQPMITTWILK
jgi:hypothetical protein